MLTLREAADRFGFNINNLRRWVRAGYVNGARQTSDGRYLIPAESLVDFTKPRHGGHLKKKE